MLNDGMLECWNGSAPSPGRSGGRTFGGDEHGEDLTSFVAEIRQARCGQDAGIHDELQPVAGLLCLLLRDGKLAAEFRGTSRPPRFPAVSAYGSGTTHHLPSDLGRGRPARQGIHHLDHAHGESGCAVEYVPVMFAHARMLAVHSSMPTFQHSAFP
jgi:hypothetical protein